MTTTVARRQKKNEHTLASWRTNKLSFSVNVTVAEKMTNDHRTWNENYTNFGL